MSAIDRYRDHLARQGVDRDAEIVDHAALQLGDMHFLDAGGAARAAVTPTGLIGGGRDPDDAWYELLGAGDAATIAHRIAWLESRGAGRARRGPGTIVVTGATPPAAKIDPILWRAARAPARDDVDVGGRRLTAWFYASERDEPFRLIVTSWPAGRSTIEVTPAHALVDAGDAAARAQAALAGPDDQAVRWALITVAKQHVERAAPAVAALLGRPDATLRADAAVTLASLRSPDTVAALAAACAKEADPVARQMMLSALGNIGTARAIDALASLRAAIAEVPARLDLVNALARAAEHTPAAARAALAAIAKADRDAGVRRLAASYATR
jgi:hypothetical protein